MSTRSTILFGILIVFISVVIAAAMYPVLPARMATHWGPDGQVDGYMNKGWGAFLMPLIMLGIFLLGMTFPILDPLRRNVERFRSVYNVFWISIVTFLFYIFILLITWNMGFRFDFGQYMIPALGLLFFAVGVVLEQSSRNWLIGIRNPWTLTDDRVWEQTHLVGAQLFKIASVVAFTGTLFPRAAIWFVLVPAVGIAVFTTVYSYLVFRKLRKEDGGSEEL